MIAKEIAGSILGAVGLVALLAACGDSDDNKVQGGGGTAGSGGEPPTSTVTDSGTGTDTGTETDVGPMCPPNTPCEVPTEPVPSPFCDQAGTCSNATATFVEVGEQCFEIECSSGSFGEGLCDTWEEYFAGHPNADDYWDCDGMNHGPYVGTRMGAECCYLFATPAPPTSTETSTSTATSTATGSLTGIDTDTATDSGVDTGTDPGP